MTLPVILIHRDDYVRALLSRPLDDSPDIEVVASVRFIEAGVSAYAAQPDAVVVMERVETGEDGRSPGVQSLRRICAGVRTVEVLDTIEAHTVIASMRAGVTSILRVDFAELAHAVQLTASGVSVFDAGALEVLLGTLSELPRNPLSSRERDVLLCLAVGLTNAQAATRLFVSRETVKSHVAHLLRKLEVDDRLAAVDKAMRIGLLS